MPPPVAAALTAANIPHDAVALVVRGPGGRPPTAHNADRPVSPASVMKLVTSLAALDVLGPAWTWRTEVFAGGEIVDGVLKGDLVLKGYGDPRLTADRLWALTRDLRRRGIRRIEGDLVIDQSRFSLPAEDPAAFDGDPLKPYNALPAALTVERNLVRLYLTPTAEGAVRAKLDPAIPTVRLETAVGAVPGACNGGMNGVRTELRNENGTTVLAVSGVLPVECGERTMYLNLLSATATAGAWFRQIWEELGGTISGGTREWCSNITTVPFLAVESPPLAEILRDVNKWSSNIAARQVFLVLGVTGGEGRATPEAAEGRIRAWVAERAVVTDGWVWENGSGLSRHERITAGGLATLLEWAVSSPTFAEFESTLPIVAVDGTLKDRLRETPLAGHAHLKTGTLNEVKAIAGYVFDACGRREVAVMIVNHANAKAADPAVDAFLRWVRGDAAECGVGRGT